MNDTKIHEPEEDRSWLKQAKDHAVCAVRHNPGHLIVPPAAFCERAHTTGG